jgi:hypothetical protein
MKPPRRLAKLLLLLLLVLVVPEATVRLWLRATGEPYSGFATLRRVREIANALTQSVPQPGDVPIEGTDMRARLGKVAHPFLGWDNVASFPDLDEHVAAARGKTERDFWVVVLGGSVSSLFAQAVHEELAAGLARTPALAGRDVRVWNYARGSFKQPQQVVMLTWLLGLGIEPDLVLNVDGFNEVALSTANASRGMHPGYPSYNQWLAVIGDPTTDPEALARIVELYAAGEEARRLAAFVDGWGLTRSALLGSLVLRRQLAIRADAAGAQIEHIGTFADKVLAEPLLLGPAIDPKHTAGDIARVWAEGSRSLKALCDSRGALYVHVLQPTLHDEGSKPLTDEEREAGTALRTWIRGVQQGYPRLREAATLLEQDGIRFVDASRVFADVDETLYYDPCHFREPGNRLLLVPVLETLRAAVGESR